MPNQQTYKNICRKAALVVMFTEDFCCDCVYMKEQFKYLYHYEHLLILPQCFQLLFRKHVIVRKGLTIHRVPNTITLKSHWSIYIHINYITIITSCVVIQKACDSEKGFNNPQSSQYYYIKKPLVHMHTHKLHNNNNIMCCYGLKLDYRNI